MSDKNVVNPRVMPFDPLSSAAALHQFLSQYPPGNEVKLVGGYAAPVIKVRKDDPKKLDDETRKVWSFYLLNMQQRLAGTGHSQLARDAILSLLKTKELKLSVGKLLVPLTYLMKAEQERLSNANAFVKRWVANEKSVLQTAVPCEEGDAASKKELQDRDAIQTACSVLSKFSNGENGVIDSVRIRDEAYAIGHGLTQEEYKALGSARIDLLSKISGLGEWIGPEVPMLISLCIAAFGKTENEFRSDDSVKQDVYGITQALKARSDIDEYRTPTPPGTVAERKKRRSSMPVFAAPDAVMSTTANASTSSTAPTTPRRLTPEKDGAATGTAPPPKSPPPTPRRDLSGSSQGAQLTPFSTPVQGATYGRIAGHGLNMGAAILELKAMQKTDVVDGGDDTVENTEPGSPPLTPRSTPRDTSQASAGTSSMSSSNAGRNRSPKTPSDRIPLDNASGTDAISQKSVGTLLTQPRRAKSPRHPAELSTSRKDLAGSNQGSESTPFSPSSSTPGNSSSHGRSAGRGLNMGVAISALKARQKPEVLDGGDDAAVNAEPGTPPVTPRGTLQASASTSSMSSSNADSTRTPKTPSGRVRLNDTSRTDAIRQKSDGDDTLVIKPKSAKPLKRRVKSMESRSPDAADQNAMDRASKAARALKADSLKALTDTAIYKKWEAAEQHLHANLSQEASKAVGRLISYCHKVNLEQGKEQASLDQVVKMMRPQVKEAKAFVAVRNLLLAESRSEAATTAASVFPELLSLLVFAIDADRSWRQQYKAKASD